MTPGRNPRCLVRGSINIDEFFNVRHIVCAGETISSENLERRGGGKGANQAVAVARAGATVDLVGAVGDDGKWLRENLISYHVDTSGVDIVKEPTGRAIIQLTAAGENSIILFKGANYSETVLLPHETITPQTTHVLLQNEIPLTSTLLYLEYASSHGISTIFNPSPMPTPAELVAFPWQKLSWLIVNEGEALGLFNAITEPVHDNNKSLEALDVLQRLSPYIPTTNIVCTLGAQGVLAFIPGETPLTIRLPAAKLQGFVRDTTGAGDCFTGYMVAGLMQLGKKDNFSSQDIETVLRRCVQAAGMCVENRGATESIPFGKNVDSRSQEIDR